MNFKRKMKEISSWWHEKHLAAGHRDAKTALQRGIEQELARLKQEDTPRNKQTSRQKKQHAAHFADPSLSNIFQQ